jgi:hypothetical protein
MWESEAVKRNIFSNIYIFRPFLPTRQAGLCYTIVPYGRYSHIIPAHFSVFLKHYLNDEKKLFYTSSIKLLL